MDFQITCNGGADSGGAVRCTDWLDVRRTHLDLFSGIGGFALAANAAGYKTIGFSEIEPYACKILKRHWPDVPNYGDIRNVRGIRCELLTGGFPCQPFSVAGKRRGSQDDRHLWPEMCRVIAEARPTWVLGENVPGIVGMELDSIMSDLEGIGYSCWPLVIPALAVDARHRRDRLWIVANSTSLGRKETANGRKSGQSVSVVGGQESTSLAHSVSGGRIGPRVSTIKREGISEPAGCGQSLNGAGPADCHRWPTEPELGRVANGIPNRAHRIQGLGNAIVPQIAETLIRMMARTSNTVLGDCGAKTISTTK